MLCAAKLGSLQLGRDGRLVEERDPGPVWEVCLEGRDFDSRKHSWKELKSPSFPWKLLCLICKVQRRSEDISASITPCKFRPWGQEAPVSHSIPLIRCAWVTAMFPGNSTGRAIAYPRQRLDKEPRKAESLPWVEGSTGRIYAQWSLAPCLSRSSIQDGADVVGN